MAISQGHHLGKVGVSPIQEQPQQGAAVCPADAQRLDSLGQCQNWNRHPDKYIPADFKKWAAMAGEIEAAVQDLRILAATIGFDYSLVRSVVGGILVHPQAFSQVVQHWYRALRDW